VLYPHPDTGTEPSPATGGLRGLLLVPPDEVAEVVVPVTAEGAVALVVVPVESLAGTVTPTDGFDQGAGWSLVTTTASASPTGDRPVPAGAEWTRAVAAGRRALAAEIIGTCEAALELAVAHTTARVQYGRPIGSFQAVRHRLAEAHVAIGGARATLAAAWAASSDPGGTSWAATIAKLRAGQAQAEVMRHAVQVLGAMGLTRESELHRYVARAAALDALLGGHLALTEALGVALLSGAELHPVAEI
jgi:alkylation response protein AidB-like acyl-CoA dehydrogenase